MNVAVIVADRATPTTPSRSGVDLITTEDGAGWTAFSCGDSWPGAVGVGSGRFDADRGCRRHRLGALRSDLGNRCRAHIR